MLGLGFQRNQRSPRELLLSSLVSCVLVLLSHFTLAIVPSVFSSLSLLAMLPISGLVWGATIAVGRCLRWLLGVSGLAPALVLFNILFLWGVYVVVIRRAVSSLLDAMFNIVCALLLFGFYRILSCDPGLVGCDPSPISLEQSDPEAHLTYENRRLFSRVRYCDSCKRSVRGFDHHCYAFGNCIGQKNHHLFMILVSGFFIAEASYAMCANKWRSSWQFGHKHYALLCPTAVMAGTISDMAYLLHLFQYQNSRVDKLEEISRISNCHGASSRFRERFLRDKIYESL